MPDIVTLLNDIFFFFSLQQLKRKIGSVSGIDVNNTSQSTNNNTTTTPNTANNLSEASVFNFENSDGTHSAAKISKNSSTGNLGNINATNGANVNGVGDGKGGHGNSGGNSTTTSSSVNTSSAVGPGLVPSLRVQIVQEISGQLQQDAPQTIHTNVTVSSRYSTGGGGSGGGGASPNSHSVHTSVQCKQEPASGEDANQQQHLRPNSNNSNGSNNNYQNFNTPLNNNHNHNNNNSNHTHDSVDNIGIGIDDIGELENILESIEREKNGHIDPSLLKELNDFKEICDQVQRNSESGESAAAMYGSQLNCVSPGALSNASSKGGGSVFSGLGNMFDPPQPMGGVTSGPNIPMSGTIPEPTGPAAETLKQLAAHHQHQQQGPPGATTGYGMKGAMMGGDPFTDGIGGLRANGGFAPTYPQMYRPHGPSPTGQAPGYPVYDNTPGHHSMAQMTPEMAAAMGYNTTKPLSHFQSGAVVGNGPPQMGTHPSHNLHHNSPSSLQQLQNQVQSHFKPGPGVAVGVTGQGHQLQMSQSQHMQVSHGAHSMQMSQTQQVHIQQQQHHQQTSHQQQQQQQHVTLSQQQNFSISQQQMVSEQVKMQMMEKMRMEQQQQQQHHHQQHQQQHPHHHQRMPPQYMGRPPPEYKMHPNARHGPYSNVKPGTSGVMGPGMNQNTSSNPLQTMQNMVNQTTAYGTVKTEIVTAASTVTSTPGSGMQPQQGLVSSSTTQMTAVQQQTITMTSSNNMGTSVPQQSGQVNGTLGTRPGFTPQPQHMQQPPAYSSSLESASSSSTISRSHAPSSIASTTSASTPTSSSPSPSSTAATPSTYTSAIMRNQRPPNVNVGPDGLNISHSRSHNDWPVRGAGASAPMMQGSMRPGMTHPGAPGMQGGHVMQYGARPPHYGAPSNMAAAAAAAASNMAQLQQQGQVGGIRGQGVRAGTMMTGGGGGQMMMQRQQTMHMSQQMAMHASNTGYSMGGPSPGGAANPTAGYALGGPSPGAPNPDYGMSGPSAGTPGATAGYVMGGPSPGITQTNPGYAMGGPSPGAGPGSNHGAFGIGGPSPGLSGSNVGGYPIGGGPSPGANTPLHTASGAGGVTSNQQPSAVQSTGYPPPSTSTPNQDAFLHFLDNPLSTQPMFDSIQTSTPDDFNLLEDILNCK